MVKFVVLFYPSIGRTKDSLLLLAFFQYLCMVQFYLLPSPPGNPQDKSSPSDPGVGNCLKRSCPGGRGRGKSKFSCEAPHFSVDTMVPDRVKKTACFQGKSLEFVADWLEKNNLSKLKSVFEGTFIINC